MASALGETDVLFAPAFVRVDRGDVVLLLDPEGPHWLGVDPRGAAVAERFRGGATAAQAAAAYAAG
jgi:hypothetical protein